MNENVTKEQIKGIILSTAEEIGVKIKDIILFGSRAQGNNKDVSDWDLLIVTEKTYNIKKKMQIREKINKKLAELLIPCDIIINSEKEVEIKREKIGYVTRYAIKEGIKI